MGMHLMGNFVPYVNRYNHKKEKYYTINEKQRISYRARLKRIRNELKKLSSIPMNYDSFIRCKEYTEALENQDYDLIKELNNKRKRKKYLVKEMSDIKPYVEKPKKRKRPSMLHINGS